MPEKDIDVTEMRRRIRLRKPRRTFMKAEEVRRLREQVMRVTQPALAEQLDDPDTGEPISISTISRWEGGTLAVPLWAARRIKRLADEAQAYDARRPGT